jgi:hypothetical protein
MKCLIPSDRQFPADSKYRDGRTPTKVAPRKGAAIFKSPRLQLDRPRW